MISHTKDWIPPLERENIYKESISSSSIWFRGLLIVLGEDGTF